MIMDYFWTILITASLPLWCDSVIIDSVFTNHTRKEIDFINPDFNEETRQAGLVKFEGETHFESDPLKFSFDNFENKPNYVIKFEDNPTPLDNLEAGPSFPLKFEDNPTSSIKFETEINEDYKYEPNPVTFQDDNSVDQNPVQKKKKRRRRRRKPRQQIHSGNLGYPAQGLQNQGFQSGPQNTESQYPGQGYDFPQNPNIYGNPGYSQGQHRPPRRPRRPPSPDALSTIVSAFSSIARYDDAQCVPRLLCEAAGGTLAGGLPQALTGLQPLLTLLSAYNGVSTSPLFVFGRAVFLGMASKGNPAICRYAYNACPTDPEQLVHYLNNHNGGFFRFFNSPQVQQNQQNLEHFYNQLSGSYGLQQPDVGQQNYGYYGPSNQGPHYGIDHAQNQGPSYGLVQSQNQQNYGLYQQNGQHNTGPYYSQNYGSNYPYGQNQYGLAYNIRYGNEKEIQNRIQNIPTRGLSEGSVDVSNSFKWSFPGSHDYTNNAQDSAFKFPEQSVSREPFVAIDNHSNRDSKYFTFPHNQFYQSFNRIPQTSLSSNNAVRYDTVSNKYVNSNQNGYVINSNRPLSNQNQGIRTVYVVRGNGDPNNPEIVNLRPGEKLT